MAQTIEKIIYSKTTPSDKGVLWVDLSSMTIKAYNNGNWIQLGGGGNGGGLVEPGIPGDLVVVNEDGETIVDSLIPADELSAIIDLIGDWDQETVDLVKNASKISWFLKILIGVEEIPIFAADHAYAKGDICLKDNVLYRFINPHLGSWNDADVVVTNFYKEFVRYYSGASDNETVSVQLNFDSTVPTFTGKYITVTYGQSQTTDVPLSATGAASFTMAKGTQYSISFPTFADYNQVNSRSYTAYLESRSVDVTYYHQGQSLTEEQVTIKSTFTNTTASYPSGAVSVTDTTASSTQTYNLDATGQCTFTIPVNHLYTITMPGIANYITPRAKSFTAQLARRTVESKYAPSVSGMFIMDANMNLYTFEEWQAAGKTGAEAKYFFCSSATLSAGGANFFFNLDDIRSTGSTPGKQWLSLNIQVTTLPNRGNKQQAVADFGVLAYDPSVPHSGPISNQEAIRSFIQDQAAEGVTYTSSMVDYALTKNLTIGQTTYEAYIGTSGQWLYLSTEENYGTFKRIMQYIATGDGDASKADPTMPADPLWTSKNFWTSTQYSSTNSWNLGVGSLSYNGHHKGSNHSVLCFYAL